MNFKSVFFSLLLGMVCSIQVLADTTPKSTLDALHDAGAAANQTAFLSLLTPDAVFLGVDGDQALEGQALADFIRENFTRGNAWAYHTKSRDIRVSADGSVAWFEEILEHDETGTGWGSGVLVKTSNEWKVTLYHLGVSMPTSATHTAVGVSTNSSAPSTTGAARTEPETKEECRKIRHKTNKQARC